MIPDPLGPTEQALPTEGLNVTVPILGKLKLRDEEFLSKSKMVSLPFVCAQSLDLDHGKKEILKENLAVFEELGFGIEVADNSKVKLTKVPHCDRIVLGKYISTKLKM